MLRILAISTTLTILLGQPVIGKVGFNAAFRWPLKLNKQFSSGFGDIRPGRFHMGLDLRTNGQEGAQVYAPENGYVLRLKTSYTGYGKALYIKGISGRIYVFGHLQKYNWDIGTWLRDRQIADHRYYEDLEPGAGVLPVKEGEFIARTGQSGAGAPHLHFEVRDPGGNPTNPMYYEENIRDNTPPRFEAVWLTARDDTSLYERAAREIKLQPVYDKKTHSYVIADTVNVSGRIGIEAAIEDVIGKGSFALGPSQIRLLIDDLLYHQTVYDRLSFDENIYSLLDRDPDPRKSEYKRVFNLFRKPGSRLSNYTSVVAGDGTFSDTVAGYHDVQIEASDPSGNTARLDFVFYYCTTGEILSPFNKVEFTDSAAVFTYDSDRSRFDFDSAALFMMGNNTAADTVPVKLSPQITVDDDYLTVKGLFDPIAGYRLELFKNDRACRNYYFSTAPVIPEGQRAVDSVLTDILDDGILFTATACSPGINWLQAEIVTDVGSERRFYRKAGNRNFSLYYHPGPEVTAVQAIITRGPVGFRPDTATFSIFNAQAGTATTVNLRPGCSLSFDAGDLFDDVLLSIEDTVIAEPLTGYYICRPFVIGPITAAFADWADLQIEITEETIDPAKIGLYVFDVEKGWLWAGGEYDPVNRIWHAPLGGAGVVALIADTTAPVIADLNLMERKWVKSDHPPVQFKLTDELSGIENDLNFNVTIDGQWIVPEYDPERETFTSAPHWRLTGGNHTLRIEVHDRCGNTATLTREFLVGAKTGP